MRRVSLSEAACPAMKKSGAMDMRIANYRPDGVRKPCQASRT